ncbi:uncharacterized protein LOC132183013 [Corylus avellana]|uniref:uncharacterized protein LOC132183013 n=1 Tax=Corylus avellana TaxID=13451 RepID=UPI001E238B5B|nr:uncharacterized protein LOC132183013 [Corylus avellana]XP_059452382.1 uncharacterized protein LOC132183013 [Corylus avellana]XP_059452383.1 uncharacterized protein LOC132183013 [Corylus avellana]
MAEESVNLPLTPEITKADGNNLRRNSTGKASSSNGGEAILPHYLRASTGSCHDFCKYGRKHALEAKARSPILKRVGKKPTDTGFLLVSVDLPGRKKMPVVKLKPDFKSQESDIPETIKQEVPTQSPVSKNPTEGKLLTERRKTSGVKFKSSSHAKTRSYDTPKTMKREVSSSSGKVEVSSKKDSSKAKNLNLSMKHATSLKLESLTVKPISSPKFSGGISSLRKGDVKIGKREVSSSSEKVEVSSKKGSSNAKNLNLSKKNVTSLKPESLTVMPISSPKFSGGISSLRKGDVKIGKTTGMSKVAVKKAMASPTASLSLKSSVNSVAGLNERRRRELQAAPPLMNKNKIRKAEPKQPNNDEVMEKTLYVIKMETENKTLESDQNEGFAIEFSPALSSSPKSSSLPNAPSSSSYEEESQEDSECTMSEAEYDSLSENSVENIEEADTLEEGYKGRPTKDGMVCSEDKNCQPLKLKFRRGKVVDVHSVNNSPRRLKFKRGKLLGEDQNVKADARRRSFKRTEGVDGDTNGSEPGSQKVVLRHQDVQGKNAQGLFNNVIEETASKLAETRKSKVKALVGAFETVISLQDKKPSANTVT